jgi:hypothetical protein
MGLSPTDPRVLIPQLRRIHNVAVVQHRKDWTEQDALKAIADANLGIVYALPDTGPAHLPSAE